MMVEYHTTVSKYFSRRCCFALGGMLTLCEEFEHFVKQTEQQLWILFKSIDRNNDGRMEKGELKEALQRAGLAVPNSKLDGFFDELDSNHDGVISFDEWRLVIVFLHSLIY